MSISNRRALAESLVVIVFFLALLGALSWYGASKRSFASPARVVVILQPQEALAVWEQSNIHGRTLYLFDRKVHAKPLPRETGEFMNTEFSGPFSITALCNALTNDGLLPWNRDIPVSIEALNDIIRDRHFYDKLRRVKSIQLSLNVRNLVQRVSHLRDSYLALTGDEKLYVEKLNRLLLEAAYPLQCPVKKSFRPGEDNYMTAAIRRGIVRRIYHIIPDSAWPEVEDKLRNILAVRSVGGGYRLNIHEGVPVIIMRLRDIEPESNPVLLQIDSSHWSDVQLEGLTSLIASKALTPDIVTITAASPDTLARVKDAL